MSFTEPGFPVSSSATIDFHKMMECLPLIAVSLGHCNLINVHILPVFRQESLRIIEKYVLQLSEGLICCKESKSTVSGMQQYPGMYTMVYCVGWMQKSCSNFSENIQHW